MVAEPGVLETIAEALKGPFLFAIGYAGADGAIAERRGAPHGVLLGLRRYLVARDEDRDAALRHFRVDRIRAARLLGSSFTRQPGFDIAAHAARSFASYQDEARYCEIAWRFAPAAGPTAREFVSTPTSGWRTSSTARWLSGSTPPVGSKWSGASTNGGNPWRCWRRRRFVGCSTAIA